MKKRQIILDTETTGLSPENGDRIIELGCVELLGRKLTGRKLHLYFNPGRDSDPQALRIHGISNEFLRDKPRFEDKAEDICQYLQGAQLIIHNAAFDLGFLNMELARAHYPAIDQCSSGVLDTLALAKRMFPGKRNSLDALCDRLDIDRSNRTLHGALLDAELLAHVYLQLTRKQESLLEDADDADAGGASAGALAHMDFSALHLPLVPVSAQEAAAHEQILADIDQITGGKTRWRNFEPAPANP